ncbi:hypothetical protein [Ideonella oryzae]|uniref:Lipoprotein n=1 Tax=Ideonella oryzae TaxID=2937441 RepID=A0ABT1BFX3_9BURK|nr:hypothetical protein [Ideonella oryzae]MCO5975129.1 hypothetical protein [Ideonella oryzae]
MRTGMAWTVMGALALGGCGADVSGAAATTAAMEAQAASQAKAQEAQIQKDLNAAMQAGQQATASAVDP